MPTITPITPATPISLTTTKTIIIGTDDAYSIDTINGTTGNDEIYGLNGNDNISSGRGNDTIYGGAGYEQISAGAGNDVIYAESGGGRFYGEGGNDRIECGTDCCTVDAGTGNDTVIGGNGYDTIDLGAGDDYYSDAYSRRDEIRAGDGNDTVSGGTSGDIITGENGNDLLLGNDGDDNFRNSYYGSTASGVDTMEGGAGNDTFYFYEMQAGDSAYISDFTKGSDTIDISNWNVLGFTNSSSQTGYLCFETVGSLVRLYEVGSNNQIYLDAADAPAFNVADISTSFVY